MERLSAEKDISVSTVRRAVGMLCKIGAIKFDRPYGMRVLFLMQSTEHCDFTQTAVRNRLLDVAESFQFFALPCRAVCEIILTTLDAGTLGRWRERLLMIKESQHYDVLSYAILDLIAKTAPYNAIQLIYSELLKQLFGATTLRGLRGTQETANLMFESCLTRSIAHPKEKDFSSFCDKGFDALALGSGCQVQEPHGVLLVQFQLHRQLVQVFPPRSGAAVRLDAAHVHRGDSSPEFTAAKRPWSSFRSAHSPGR